VEFTEYVAGHRRALYRFAVVLTGDVTLADDVVADTLGRAFEKWPLVQESTNVHAYVRRMVVNEYLGWRRRMEVHLRLRVELVDLPDPRSDHSSGLADRDQLVAELRRLPVKQRAAVVLRYYEGLSFAEIADLLGTGENAVRSNISRALTRLRVQMADELAGPVDNHPGNTLEIRS
jgi:RNA polymerase sigma-70 factor (sigma-E family)